MNDDQDKPLHGSRVLLVEDEALILFSLQDILTNAGAEIVGPAASVQSAMYLAKSEAFHCAVLDVKLKDGEVYPVAKVLHRRGKGMVFVTALDDLETLQREWPTAPILSKPATARDLIEATITVIRHQEAGESPLPAQARQENSAKHQT
jgi:DNA-binding response OmpR family regulator